MVLLSISTAKADVVFAQGFETDTAGIIDGTTSPGFGTVTRVASGTGGIASSSGLFHGVLTQTDSGPFTRFDHYRSVFPGPYKASIDIYLDVNMAAGSGFDYSVASSGTNGTHRRDFIFHVTKDTSTGDLLVGASNNTNFNPREDLENLANHEEISASGWYRFETAFSDVAGVLSVDLNLYNAANVLLFTETRSDPTDLIPTVVGGNRYGWFTYIDVAGGIAVDNWTLDVPEPMSLGVLGGGLLLWTALRRRQGSRKA